MAERDAPPPSPRYARRGEYDLPQWDTPAEPSANSRLGGAPATEPARSTRTSPTAAYVANFRFTGEGAEYFRIWVVNLLLTLVTLGVYSAWAKVRKARYFWQNTRLDGHAFDFHGRPVAILIGRAIALLLVIAYSIAFDIARMAGLVVIIVLCIAGPWLFMRAQRFKLVNSSWRGLRFGFDSRITSAYASVLPPIAIWLSSAFVTVLAVDRFGLMSGLLGVASALFVPWMHHRLKAYQHRGARYGDRRFDFLSATPSFYAVYFKAVMLAMLMGGMGTLLVVMMPFERDSDVKLYALVTTAIVSGFVYLAAWPYFSARLQQVVWSHTRLGDVRFATSITAGPLFRLVAKNMGLTLISAGLYWPFASIALARYRIECMRCESSEPIEALADATSSPPGMAAGDAALDAFGLDIGL
ncbi:MAG TPA: YjgN family protein [Casimicrobiaceae bacterium]|nr:YjgN family protein [Casimicrobiaceae bacterium]